VVRDDEQRVVCLHLGREEAIAPGGARCCWPRPSGLRRGDAGRRGGSPRPSSIASRLLSVVDCNVLPLRPLSHSLALQAKEPTQVRSPSAEHRVEMVSADAVLLCLDQTKRDLLDDVIPLIAMPHHRRAYATNISFVTLKVLT
jgi:hypothetical protein